MDWFAARLAVALHDTNAEYRMGIHNLREELKHIPGGKHMTMRYEDGGMVQVFTIGEDELRFGPEWVTSADIVAALETKKKV